MKEKNFKYIGYSVWLLIMALITSFIVFSFNKIQKGEEAKAEIEKRKWHKDEYEALCLIEKNKWDSFEDYLSYVQDTSNEKVLQSELWAEGWHGLLDLSLAYSFLNKRGICNFSTVVWDENNIEKLYLLMKKEGIDTGTLKDFKESLKIKDGFVWYYDKAIEYGIVDNWETFVMLLLESEE